VSQYIMKLENCGECLIIMSKLHISYIFLFFHNNFQDTKGTKMADPILAASLTTGLQTICYDIFLLLNKKILTNFCYA